MSQDQNPLEQLVKRLADITIYLPLGLVRLGRERIREAIEAGHQELDPRLSLFRGVGEFAVGYAQKELRKRLQGVIGQREEAQVNEVANQSHLSRDYVVEKREPQDGHLPIENYDSLAASQIVELLENLSEKELEEVEKYEKSHRRRRTILTKIEQLREQPA